MQVHIDVPHNEFNAAEKALVEKARKALKPINREFRGVSPEGYPYHEILAAVVWPASPGISLRIDFKAHRAEGIGQAYLGPDTPLTEALFDGDNITTEFRAEIEESCTYFEAYMKEPLP